MFKFLLSILICMPAFGQASAFLKKQGEGFFAWEYWSYSTRRYWDKQGRHLLAHNHFQKRELNLYLEYGLTNCDTLVGKLLYDRIHQSAYGNTDGFEDPEVGWVRRLAKYEHSTLAGEILVIIPGGRFRSALRYGVWGVQFSLLWGTSFKFWDKDMFFDSLVGYRLFRGFPSDQVRAHAILGVDLTKQWQLILQSHLEYGIYNGKPVMNESVISLDPNYRLLKCSVRLRYRYSKQYSLTVGYYRHVWGRNTGSGGGFIGGLWVDF
jgi:hypothetical protein